ncbi:MLO-like protein 12 isoform X2 [Solanum dulcamara]|uniref:MLO-like protein 12 isoform X2 n=1 Tax=Solanum dulcamara TaxID=45834 RepID=UPI002485463C|nr:MLO-like protein 12 isoform X2 [Solanum dulcamara]
MAGGGGGRSLEQTPTWAVAVVCFVLVAISIVIEFIIHLIGKWLKSKHKRALFEALEKIKAELMLLGFISLLLTVGQDPISNICVSEKIASTWHPCSKQKEAEMNKYNSDDGHRRRLLTASHGGVRRVLAAAGTDKCADKGKVAFVSADGIHQLHIFIFVLAIFHVFYCITTLALGRAKVCFFRQFVRSVPKVDYLTLRHGFITAHLAPQSHVNFDFQKYIKRSLEEDFKVVVSISPPIWFLAVLFLLFNTHGWYSYLWLPFIPLLVILLVGTKLQVIITKMGLRIQERGEVVKGDPVVQPGDDLFWFNRPRLLLFLINFVLFQNAFQLAFFAWTWYEFGLKSCFHDHTEDIVIRMTMGVLIQILCSYVTLPLYALVTQMGSTMKPTIFNERVATALRKWHHSAKKHIKEINKNHSNPTTPLSSRPATPSNGMSPVHLLRGIRTSDMDVSPRRSSYNVDHWDIEGSPSPNRFYQGGTGDGSSSPSYMHQMQITHDLRHDLEGHEPSSPQMAARDQHERNIIARPRDFSFDKRTTSV